MNSVKDFTKEANTGNAIELVGGPLCGDKAFCFGQKDEFVKLKYYGGYAMYQRGHGVDSTKAFWVPESN